MPETTAKPPKRPHKPPNDQVEGNLPVVTDITPVAPKKKIGRPSKYTPELAAEICMRLSDGEPLRKICRDEHMPEWRTIYDWLARDKELSAQVTRAREAGYQAMAEETLEIADNFHLGQIEVLDDKGSRVTIEDMLGHRKLRIETRLKLLACWDPSKYGNRTVVAGDDKNPLVVEASFDVFGEVLKYMSMAKLDGQSS
jgi:hypothetical protein